MPWLQPATNNYFGFMPATGGAQINPYLVSSSEAAAIYPGDVVVMTSIGSVKAPAAGALASNMAGVAASYLAASAGSMAAKNNVNTSQLLLVYDDPLQIFVGCDTTSSVAVASTMYASTSTENTAFGQVYSVLTTGCTGSTGPSSVTLRSVMAISGTESTYGANKGVFKVLGLHPVEASLSTGAFNTAGVAGSGSSTVRKYLLRPSTHQLAGPSVVPVSTG